MGRRSGQPTTLLGVAIQGRRAGRPQREAATESSVPDSTLSRLERGTHQPSLDTVIALARWLGWSVEQVIEAARTPVPPPAEGS